MNSLDERLTRVILDNMNDKNIDYIIDEKTDLIYDLGFDSIMIIKLIVDIEDEFQIEIDDDMLEFENITKYKYLQESIIKIIKEKNSNI